MLGPGDAPYLRATYGNGSTAKPVGALSRWQMANLQLDGALRVGLPIGAFLAYRAGYRKTAHAAVAGAVLLWGNRLLGVNL